jgi:hypothetical protein
VEETQCSRVHENRELKKDWARVVAIGLDILGSLLVATFPGVAMVLWTVLVSKFGADNEWMFFVGVGGIVACLLLSFWNPFLEEIPYASGRWAARIGILVFWTVNSWWIVMGTICWMAGDCL